MKPKPGLKPLWKKLICLLFILVHIGLGSCRPPKQDIDTKSEKFVHGSDKSITANHALSHERTPKLKAINMHRHFPAQHGDRGLPSSSNYSDKKQITDDLIIGNNHASEVHSLSNNKNSRRNLREVLFENNGVDYIFVGDKALVDRSSVLSGRVFLLDDYETSQDDVIADVIDGVEEDSGVVQLTHGEGVFQRSDTSSTMDVVQVGSFIDEDSEKLGNRNLSRKRRQKATTDDVLAHGRRHRKRKRRHRLLLKARQSNRNHLKDSRDGSSNHKGRRDRFLLKSDSPGYVITSASEVKKDWCRTVPLRQKVSEPNCRSKVVMNNFCYGQCNSFFIPHSGRTGNKVAFQSCAFCKPHRPKWGNVTLNCPGRNPPKIEKTILVVESCRCITEVLQ